MPRAPIQFSINDEAATVPDVEARGLDPAAAPLGTDDEAGSMSAVQPRADVQRPLRTTGSINSMSPDLSPAGGSAKGGLSTRGVVLALIAALFAFLLVMSALVVFD